MTGSDSQIDALYALPLAEFIAARKQVAATLARQGDAAGARAVKALVKPTLSAWLTNQVVRRAPDVVKQLSNATDALAAAQRPTAGGDSSRSAFQGALAEQARLIARLSDTARDLVAELGQPTSAGVLEKVDKNLRWGPVSAELRPLFESGRLTDDVPSPGFAAFVGSSVNSAGGEEALPAVTARGGARKDEHGGGQPAKGHPKAAAAAATASARDEAAVAEARQKAREQERAAAHARQLRLTSLRAELLRARSDAATSERRWQTSERARVTAEARAREADKTLAAARAALEAAETACETAAVARDAARAAEAELSRQLSVEEDRKTAPR